MRLALSLAAILALMFSASGWAVQAQAPQLSEVQEARAKALFKELRCMVCQGETLSDSEAGLAKDLKALIRTKIAAGESDAAIKAHLVRLYGETILLSPPLSPGTWLLWFGPLFLLLAGALAAWFTWRNRRAAGLEPPLSAEEAHGIGHPPKN